ncbi:beta-ketoacyl-[acyl-carrier-protein] synthase family protein [Shewanella sp. GutDb-MelDb]|uniref:beta-ketoacyl-[acyl-carrier-protein] synthase family protein n=1 Tax=Shewanella sp. GutDb-MelDb TaxID=2058316 RepID=UPI000C7BA173|nr:beta-ketoacyl-[acyl-carrier-protein] synthase family protein [Shewanella sp. GutDb-MelDb]PKG55487.1 beta-ketoacyl-[acyl-carrier-protein] synthase II [Shewanella sp. GutDb-MelDb]
MKSNIAIAITQIGLCTPLGDTSASVLNNLITANVDGMRWRDDLMFDRPVLVGEVASKLPELTTQWRHFDTRNNQLALVAAKQIEQYVIAASTQYGANRVAVVIGTSTSGIATGEQALAHHHQHGEFPAGYDYSQQELGDSSLFLQSYFGLSGPCFTVSTACSSSAKAFASARRLLNADLCDMVIVGGVDSLCQLTLNGFNSLESISKAHCQPFSANRDGINIGEGAALFTLERATERDAIVLSGVGESSDAYHISAPHPEGTGAIMAMQSALKMASLNAGQINYLNLHGTATPKNDAMESRAVTAVFTKQLPPCSSTKPLTGHTLGAAGAIEAAFCYLLLSDLNVDNRLPPQVWDQQQDPDNPSLPLVNSGDTATIHHVMSNSFAFGGSNASLIFSRHTKTTDETQPHV